MHGQCRTRHHIKQLDDENGHNATSNGTLWNAMHIRLIHFYFFCVTIELLPSLDFGTVYLLTSGLPRHLQHFVKSCKLIYFGNLTQTLFYNYDAIVVLEVTLT